MAIICTACFPKRSANLALLRLLRQTYCEQKLVVSTPKPLINSRDAPIKFTTNNASRVPIAETIGLIEGKERGAKYTPHIVFISLAIFLVYFCLVREENDLDDILKGNVSNQSDSVTLIKLKLQLQYCEKNNLPTEPLKAKIQELENKQKLK